MTARCENTLAALFFAGNVCNFGVCNLVAQQIVNAFSVDQGLRNVHVSIAFFIGILRCSASQGLPEIQLILAKS